MIAISVPLLPPISSSTLNFQTYNGAPASNINIPVGWFVPPSSGAAGTDILFTTATPYGTTTNSLEFLGQASPVLSGIAQSFANSSGTVNGGTSVQLLPRQVIGVCVRVYSATPPAAGAFRISLTDVSNTVITNDWGTSQQSSAFSISGLVAATWTAFTAWFELPSVLPSQINIQLKLSTAITSGAHCQFSYMAAGFGQQLYNNSPASGVGPAVNSNVAGGPYAIVFSGNTPFQGNGLPGSDGALIAVANNYAGRQFQ